MLSFMERLSLNFGVFSIGGSILPIVSCLKGFEDVDEECDDFKRSVHRFDEDPRETELKGMDHFSEVEVEKVLDELGLRRKKKRIAPMEEAPQNRFWLHDTPGAINEAQVLLGRQ